MSENIEQNTAKTLANSNFALQVDETTDITGNAQLIAFVRFIHENDIINQFLCCRELPDFTTGKHIFQVISSYLEEIKVSWKSCIGICADGAPVKTGHLKGFVAHVKELNEDILVTHCFLHREAFVTKFLPSDLKIVLEQCVKMVNYIKSRPLKSRLFSKLCQDMEAKYESLLLHTEVRWLARGKVISRVLKLKDEMKIFFEQNKNYEFVHLLENKIWCTKLAYLSDIFVIFNNINSSMQGPNENILNSTDKLVGFKTQITLWKNKAQEGNLEKFESVPKDSYKTIKLIVVDHLTTLEERIIHYFPKLDIKKFDWVRNPFLITCQVISSQFGLAIHQNDHQARRRFVGWAQNEIAVVPDFHKRILFSDEAHFWFNGYVNKQNCRIWSEANPQVYVETPLHPEKLTVWCALWAGGILIINDEAHNVTVNGDRYRAMITNFFFPELKNHDVQELWFQQDGATCHTDRATIDLLKDTFGDRLISRFEPVNWPPRSVI
ncbi:SCAN domain-containing protein 3 [Trichonephila clavipes]|nr:SCAN domain-containing protein 3 [Trichonephila clavipes]